MTSNAPKQNKINEYNELVSGSYNLLVDKNVKGEKAQTY